MENVFQKHTAHKTFLIRQKVLKISHRKILQMPIVDWILLIEKLCKIEFKIIDKEFVKRNLL